MPRSPQAQNNFAPLAVVVLDGRTQVHLKQEMEQALLALTLPMESLGRSWYGVWHTRTRRTGSAIPTFVAAISTATQGRMIPSPGGVLIINADNDTVIGAVGISGDIGDNDEICAITGIEAAGLSALAGAAKGQSMKRPTVWWSCLEVRLSRACGETQRTLEDIAFNPAYQLKCRRWAVFSG
ncbi:MAG: heme-binding protein [Anaerolineae bacterium]